MSEPKEKGGLAGGFPYWGMDGCNGKWLCVGLDGDDGVCSFVACDIACAYKEIGKYGGEIILIDMPIGLPWDKNPRCCDVMARNLVGDRRSSVFRTPNRQAVDAYIKESKNLKKAKYAARKKNKEVADKDLSAQSLSIVPKIHEVDDFLRSHPDAKKIVREVHPELCFRMLAGAPLRYSKKSQDGHKERKKILCHYLARYLKIYAEIRKSGSDNIVKGDDIHDALVAALTVKLGTCKGFETATVPPQPTKDQGDLPMEMVYVKPSRYTKMSHTPNNTCAIRRLTKSPKVIELAKRLRNAKRPVFFTGAGISTESGLPDFRGVSGFWKDNQPIRFHDFMESVKARRLSWVRNREIIKLIDSIKPNVGHCAIAGWMLRRPDAVLITQNIDGLHQRAGAPMDRCIELHGNATYATCLDCGVRHDPAPFHRAAEGGDELPGCSECGGLVKSATISFGQMMPKEAMERAGRAVAGCDLMLVAGSSLVVQPAATLPAAAASGGVTLAIVNREVTPLDELAEFVIHDELGDVFEVLCSLVGMTA